MKFIVILSCNLNTTYLPDKKAWPNSSDLDQNIVYLMYALSGSSQFAIMNQGPDAMFS